MNRTKTLVTAFCLIFGGGVSAYAGDFTTTIEPVRYEGMVSISFDDSYRNQHVKALPILEAAGMKGTFYLSTKPIQKGYRAYMTPAQVKDLARKGHEVAGHTVSHANLAKLGRARIEREVGNSKAYLEKLIGVPVTGFAYPYGAISRTAKVALKKAGYTHARGVDFEELNTPATDRYALKSQCVDKSDSLASIQKRIDTAKAEGKWYILCFHRVQARGGGRYAVTPAFFQKIVDYIKATGIKVVTVKSGLAAEVQVAAR